MKVKRDGEGFYDRLTPAELLELSGERLIMSPKCSEEEIKSGVKKWMSDVRRQDSYVPKKALDVEGDPTQPKGFVPVLGRAVLLGVNAVKIAKDTRCESQLVGQMYSGWGSR